MGDELLGKVQSKPRWVNLTKRAIGQRRKDESLYIRQGATPNIYHIKDGLGNILRPGITSTEIRELAKMAGLLK